MNMISFVSLPPHEAYGFACVTLCNIVITMSVLNGQRGALGTRQMEDSAHTWNETTEIEVTQTATLALAK